MGRSLIIAAGSLLCLLMIEEKNKEIFQASNICMNLHEEDGPPQALLLHLGREILHFYVDLKSTMMGRVDIEVITAP